jgi:hypothetical protein
MFFWFEVTEAATSEMLLAVHLESFRFRVDAKQLDKSLLMISRSKSMTSGFDKDRCAESRRTRVELHRDLVLRDLVLRDLVLRDLVLRDLVLRA